MTTSTETTSAPTRASLASWLSLAVLLISTLYTYADRQIFALQAEPLRKALELSDLQFGLLQGPGPRDLRCHRRLSHCLAVGPL